MQYEIPENATILYINDSFVDNKSKWCELEGLLISTDKGDIKLMIENGRQCCENFGNSFLETPDDIEKYIGAKILAIEDTNDALLNDGYECESDETQLKIITNRGVLQYAVYNEHNGYYSHGTFLQVFDIKEEGSL